MASKTSDKNNTDGNHPLTTPPIEMYDDDATELAGKNPNQNAPVEREFHVKWQMPGNQDLSAAKKQLHQLLSQLLVSFPSCITMIDGKQREWIYDEADNSERFEKELETAFVQIHPIKNRTQQISRWISIIKFRTALSIKEWKDNDQFYSLLNEAGTYLFPHPFDVNDWNIVTIGFIKDIHVIHFPRDFLHDQIIQMIKQQETNPPNFQIIPQKITTTDKKASTKAFTVQCPKKDAPKLLHLLTHGPFREHPNQIFVPFKFKRSKPDTFLKCIRQLNDMYYKTWVIKVEGITQDVMSVIEQDILNTKGVMHIVPSKRLTEIGEWKILTDQSKCAFVHRQLSETWNAIMAKVPPELLQEAPSNFASPAISSKRAWEYQDDDSADDSYGSLLTNGTEISAMTIDDPTLNELPLEFQYPTYASAAMGSNATVSTNPASLSTSDAYLEWQKEKQELEAQIRNQAQQIEKIQADLMAKISRSKDLEDQLAQAIQLAHSRDARHEEMLEKFEQLMRCQTSGINTTSDQAMAPYPTHDQPAPSTPERFQMGAPSPPSKKANTNASPNRIYALFRQPQGRPPTTRPNNYGRQTPTNRSNQLTITNQPMDIDDTSRQPKPGAKPGKKQE